MPRKQRRWHPAFLEYMKFIVSHPNYAGMPDPYKSDGSIRWVVAADSELGRKRMAWWDKKREEIGISREKGCWQKVARAIHPTGEKPCQICGTIMKLDYIYPNKRGGFSPGAMSDAPDRFDGYHSYNLCCRSREDLGRHDSNLQRYGQDRRAYEFWSEGDWKAADWLMKVFAKHGVSPDHVGPISLGFCHSPKFRATTLKGNIDRRNVMSYNDVQELITREESGEQVVSWHSKFIWDRLKHKILNDTDAIKASKLMRRNLHCVLSIFGEIKRKGFVDFLARNFLHPEYAFYSIEFRGFDPKTGNYSEMVKKRGNIKQYRNNAARYVRKSFAALSAYETKANRRVKILEDPTVDSELAEVYHYLDAGKENEAKKALGQTFNRLAENLVEKFWNV